MSEIGFYELFLLFCFSAGIAAMMATFVVVGFLLGAYVVYRTRRDSTEPFFGHARVKEEAGAGQAPDDMESPGEGGPMQYGAPDEEENIPMGGDVNKHLYGTPDRREQFMSDFSMESSQSMRSPQREAEEGEKA